ncbi:MAG: hypothetical protein R2912_05350 [Eubacteriales bacterium]
MRSICSKERKTRLRYALLPLGTAVLALSSARSFALFSACGIFPLAYFLKDVTIPEGKIKSQQNVLRLRMVLLALVVLVVGGLTVQRVVKAVQAGDAPAVSQAMNYLIEHEEKDGMVLYAGYNDGGFAEYKGYKPYIDPVPGSVRHEKQPESGRDERVSRICSMGSCITRTCWIDTDLRIC